MLKGLLQYLEGEATAIENERLWRWLYSWVGLALLFALIPLSSSHYLLFHTLVELSGIAVAVTLFIIGWNARLLSGNKAFIFLAIAFLPIAIVDLLHTLAYKGMGVFPTAGIDPPTQLWIAARWMQAAAFFTSSLLIGTSGRLHAWRLLSIWLLAASLLVASIWPLGIFPSCLTEGEGLTAFKVGNEYLICGLLLVSILLIWSKRRHLDPVLTRYLVGSVALTILSELSFTIYTDVYGLTNVLGHLLKLGAVFMVYKALIIGALRKPHQTLFRDLAESHAALDEELIHRREAEENLLQANQELDAFVHSVSHDLRTPLTVIIGGAEVLVDQLQDTLDVKSLNILNSVQEQGLRMSRLLSDLLDLARIGHLDSPPERVETEAIAKQVVEELQMELHISGHQVIVDELPPLMAHPTLIYQLLANLIGNAVRYGANPSKPIVVSGTRDERRTRLMIRDHGPGIPEHEHERIFEVFYRTDHSKSEGTGIGLATVLKIARFYQGRVSIEESPGGGATFVVEFGPGLTPKINAERMSS